MEVDCLQGIFYRGGVAGNPIHTIWELLGGGEGSTPQISRSLQKLLKD